MARFSIVMPTFNRPHELKCAVQSVLAQTEADWELLVVNDGSTDIAPVLAEAAGNDPRVRALATAGGRGAAHARNVGIQAATGEVVCFLDDDDAYEPGYLAAMAEMFRGPDLDLSWTGVHWARDRGRHPAEHGTRIWDRRSDAPGSLRFVLEIGASYGTAVRRERLLQHGGFDEALRTSEDRDLLLRLIGRGCRYASVPRPLARIALNRGLSGWRHSPASSAASARDDEVVMARHAALLDADPSFARDYRRRVARKYFRAGDRGGYWRVLRQLAGAGALSFKLVWRGLLLASPWRRAPGRGSPGA